MFNIIVIRFYWCYYVYVSRGVCVCMCISCKHTAVYNTESLLSFLTQIHLPHLLHSLYHKAVVTKERVKGEFRGVGRGFFWVKEGKSVERIEKVDGRCIYWVQCIEGWWRWTRDSAAIYVYGFRYTLSPRFSSVKSTNRSSRKEGLPLPFSFIILYSKKVYLLFF